MNYFFLYQTLKAHFSSEAPTHASGESAFGYCSHEFHSQYAMPNSLAGASAFDIEGSNDAANNHFSYPIFHPNKEKTSDGCIILLHGLNERSWDKYLPWGYQLANYTNKTVILFPIAHHINRSPKNWGDPREMADYVRLRKTQAPDVKQLSVVNVALSERLSDHPERFLLSGYQAANDVLDLVKYIRQGNHPLIKGDAKVDFFAYSIGSFLAQVMFLAHHDDLLAQSKLFIFCGGCAFEDWQGTSKYIMDSKAFECLQRYYKEGAAFSSQILRPIFNETAMGQSFVNLLSVKNLRKRGLGYYSGLRDRVNAVVLKQDSVALADKVKNALKGMQVDEWHFNYDYSHIMPFPITSNKLVNQVNEAFDRLMLRASLLFTT
ncbi:MULTISPECIES: DUF6051 family protein [unclassified Carboxylicivirga]|uniref:DUF6051 family protein n=1 Tax=Carboxylicivirga TaxID=1628153 RepID=UPI003D338A50